MVIVGVGAGVGVLCFVEGMTPLYAVLCGLGGCALVVLGLHKFFFASRYEIDEEGITAVHFLTSHRMEWQHTRRFLHDERGGYLSRRAIRTRLDAWQGMHLQWPTDDDARTRAINEIKKRACV